MDLRKLDRLPVNLPTLTPQQKSRIALGLALVLLLPSAYSVYYCFGQAWELQSLSNTLESANAGYDDVGRRLSFRFGDSAPGDAAAGLYRMQIAREASGWWAGTMISMLIASWSWYRSLRTVWRMWIAELME